ncbi:type II secretion system F family protein [Nostoc sp. CHAB 5834]|nr:type II secretion system F family protein [Nostoc sp. CHAB 5834]
MDIAFKYLAKSSRGHRMSGIVHASGKPLAFAKLKKGGFLPIKVEMSPLDTISGWFHPSFNKSELARLYTTVGRRLSNGKSMVEGLEAASEYIEDARLRQAVMLMRQSVLDGQNEFQAMQAAGFPKRDCLVIKSTSESGKTGESFISLGDEITRVEALRKSVASTFRMPAMMGVFMVLFVWAALMFIAPATMNFLKQTGLKLNFSPLISAYFRLVEIFHVQAIVSSVIYFGAFAGFAYFLRSETFKKFLDKFKSLRTLSVKSDHAALWNSFCLLYDAAVPAREAAAIVGDSARRHDSKISFLRLSKLVESGRSLEDAVAAAGFPQFVISGISSASSGGDMVQGITDMVRNLEEDARVLTAILQENAKIASVLAMGAGVMLVFVFTYYPMIASVMSNV